MNVDERMLLAAWPYLKASLAGELWHMHVHHDDGCPYRPCRCRPEIEIQRHGDPHPLYRLALVGGSTEHRTQ